MTRTLAFVAEIESNVVASDVESARNSSVLLDARRRLHSFANRVLQRATTSHEIAELAEDLRSFSIWLATVSDNSSKTSLGGDDVGLLIAKALK